MIIPCASANLISAKLSRAFTNAALTVLTAIALLGFGCGRKRDSVSLPGPTKDRMPQTLAELNAWYAEPPSGQNAAEFYMRGFGTLQIAHLDSSDLPLVGKGPLPAFGSQIPEPMRSALAAVLLSNEDALQFFAAGSIHPESRYPLDLTRGVDAIFPHDAGVRQGMRIVALSAMVHADAQQGEEAAHDVLTALALAE